MQKISFILIVLLSLLWASAVAASGETTSTCTRGAVSINEIDYDQPGLDNLEFVELDGTPNASLDDYEVRFINSSGAIYRTISLDGYNITSGGFFVIGNNDLFNQPQLPIGDKSIDNNRSVVAIYDNSGGLYCNAINYEGTVSGFSDWFNIGADTEAHGEGRGCARSSSGWWSCNRPTTPQGSNGVVAVQLGATQTSILTPFGILLLFVLCCVTTFRLAFPLNR